MFSLDVAELCETLFVLTTNQGVVGSIPASRTIKGSPAIKWLQAFCSCAGQGCMRASNSAQSK